MFYVYRATRPDGTALYPDQWLLVGVYDSLDGLKLNGCSIYTRRQGPMRPDLDTRDEGADCESRSGQGDPLSAGPAGVLGRD